MKVTDFKIAGLRGATPAGGWSREIQHEECVHTLLLLHTDADVWGLGSIFTHDALVRGAMEILWPFLQGENALEPERVTETLHQNTFWMGRGGSVTHAISGIDLALWDILGKVTGQPVGRLLGGRYRESVMPYASLLMDAPCRLSDALAALRREGFQAFKMGWGPFGRVSDSLDEEIVQAARATVGPDALLMVDAGASDAFWRQDLKWAQRTAQMLARYDVTWFEEPLSPDALHDYRELRRSSPVPVAGGEVLTRRQTFQPWLAGHAWDIVQPDVTKVGGISEMRKIGWTAHAHGIRLIPHGWNTAVGLAADLQLASALPDTHLVEYISGSVYVDALKAGGWQLDAAGELEIPGEPGLGIALDPDVLARVTGQPDFLPA